MKATAKRTVSTATAMAISSHAIEAVGEYLTDPEFGVCRCHDNWGPCTCGASYESVEVTASAVTISPDHYGAEMGIKFPAPDTIEVWGKTVSGCYQSLAINIATGELVAIHNGSRRSSLGLVCDLLPEEYFYLADAKDWRLTSLETSRPDWGVPHCLLNGQLKPGPTNLEEYRLQVVAKRTRRLCRLAGYKIPPGVTEDSWSETGLSTTTGDVFRPDFLGVHISRLAANGVRV